MTFIFSYKTNKKLKVFANGGTLGTLTLIIAICRSVAEEISKERGVELEQAIKFINECIEDGYESLD